MAKIKYKREKRSSVDEDLEQPVGIEN